MKKSTQLKTVNALIAFAFVILAASAAIAKIVPDLSESVFEIHIYAGYAFFIFAIAHIALNWSWIKANVFKSRGGMKRQSTATEK
jgi:hypothetical protein